MDDLDGIPRKGHEPDGIRGMWKVIRSLQDAIRVLQRAAPQRSMSLTDGGDLTIKNGGRVVIEGQGEAVVVGEGPAWWGGDTVPVKACLGNRVAYNPWIGYEYTQPGVYFTKGESRAALDPRVISEDGNDVQLISASELLQYGPQVGPNIRAKASASVRPWSASIGAGAWDESVNIEGGDGLEGLKGSASAYFTPSEFSLALENYGYQEAIPQGTIARIWSSLEDRVLRLSGMDGVDIKGPLTVDGQPVGGGTWGSITGKPTTFPPSAHAHSTSQVTGLDTALDGKAPTTHSHSISQVTNLQATLDGKAASTHTHAPATTSAAGFMSAADKTKLDGIPAGATAVSYYIATGSKEAYAAFDQAITTPVYQAAGSTASLGAPGAGQITISASGIYSVVLSLALFTSNTLATPKAVTGRTFIEVADGSGSAYARTTIALEEDQGTSNHAGLVLAAGSILKFNVLQNTGGIAHYRARIWVIKHP